MKQGNLQVAQPGPLASVAEPMAGLNLDVGLNWRVSGPLKQMERIGHLSQTSTGC